MSIGLPLFTLERPTAPRSINVFEDEKTEVEMLVAEVVNLVRGGVTGMDLLETFLDRRI